NIFLKKAAAGIDGNQAVKIFRKRDMLAIFLSGFFMNLLNPGVFIFWIAASASIVADAEQQPHPSEYRIIVFVTCLLFVLLSDCLKVMLAGKIRERLNPHNVHIINIISGIIFIGFGVALIWGLVTHKLPK
ncbi:MAG TPA: LysE family transporter, partial [Chitinophagaceae bacterium]|nr:LysE family transporter [Chitinophagaceae bacterium]